MPLVSVIIPAFKASAVLENTVDSALRQTFQDFEIIIVDDCSPDDTFAVASRIAERDARIKVVRSEVNGRVARTRNRAIALSSGEFIAPLDADDIWHSTKLDRQLSAFAKAGADTGFVYCPNRRIDDRDIVIGSSPFVAVDGDAFDLAVLYNFVGTGSAPMFRRAAIASVEGYCEDARVNGVEDALIQIMVAERWKVRSVPAYLVGYRRSASSLSSAYQWMHSQRINMLDIVARTCPRVDRDALKIARAASMGQRAMRELLGANFIAAAKSLHAIARTEPMVGIAAMTDFVRGKSGALLGRTLGFSGDGSIGRPFLAVPPELGVEAALAAPPDRRVRQLDRRRLQNSGGD